MLRTASSGPVTTLTLDRPEVRNAINDELIAALTAAVASLPETCRVLVIQGEGKGFCAGGDLEWMRKAAGYTKEQNHADALKIAQLFEAITHCHAVTIARVHGAAFGGGGGLVCACDVAVAAPDAMFSFSEVRLGLIPSTISPFVIAKIGAGHARALFTTGEAFGAEHALRIGMVHAIGDLDELVAAKVKQVLSVGPKAAFAAKNLVLDSPLTADETAARLAEARAGDEGVEGVAAFLERRKASFVVEP